MKTTVIAPQLVVLAGLLATSSLHAQIGSGWTQRSHVERLQWHHSGGPNIEQKTPAPSSFSDDYVSYSNSGGVRTFVFKNFTAGRCEIRVNNDYTSGQRQFQGTLNFSRPTSMASDYSQTTVMQVFGAATHAAWKLTVRKDGTLRAEHGIVCASDVYGKSLRVNVIHNKSGGKIQVYVNGSKKVDRADEGGSSHYFKYGMYQGRFVGRATWSSVKYFSK